MFYLTFPSYLECLGRKLSQNAILKNGTEQQFPRMVSFAKECVLAALPLSTYVPSIDAGSARLRSGFAMGTNDPIS